ncbi:hypothetical protein [Gallionella capsiferriformans]|uniref:Uncharacterized protein n=1 Tax=Gallionella capsiferriformans (strain ES-2) TaxID=395494 RepID=D9SH13_GALCS|nr:hypothetical protein [Gallionella capsiferriformans]ADL55810.1 hypothetical protein Galf_1799 [Gallionella capsiferriformans ES-2]
MNKVINSLSIGVLVSILCTGCSPQPAQNTKSEGVPFIMHCTEHLPEFSLGVNSHPSIEQQSALCSCIYNGLSEWTREVAEKLHQKKDAELTYFEQRAFPSGFGEAYQKCGGMNL